VAGVAGELYTQSYVSDADTNIQAFNTWVLKEAQDRASVARLEAGIADLKAACANERAAVAEAKARAAMLLQLEWRSFTKQQMDAFVADIRGHVTEMNVFTLPDPEAAQYGLR
jgi:hypothetical protein